MRSRRFQLVVSLSLLVALFGISVTPKLAFSDDVVSDAAAPTDDSQLAASGSDDGQTEAPDISLDASYDEFVEHADEYFQDMPDPEHMWSGDNGISLFSGSPYWQTVNGRKAFYDAYGNVYANPAIKVVDVSHHQGDIDWDQVKNSDVDAVILRVGYGVGNEDRYIARNIAEVRRLNIPYGVYLYSYAYNTDFAAQEAAWTATLLDKYGTEGMALPIYYDLEQFNVWDGHRPPTDPNTYEAMVNTYCDVMASRGYSDVHVYSYRAYLQSALNKPSIWARTSWIAAYTSTIGIDNPYYDGQRGWQYTASGSVPGINGNADISAFTDWGYINVEELPLVNLDNGTYYINSHLKDSSSVTISGGSLESGARTELWSADKLASQRFIFTRQDNGSYVIINEASGLALDVQSGVAGDGAVVQQYEPNGTPAQRWFIRDAGSGYYLQSELGNWVLDIDSGVSADGTSVRLYTPNGSAAQRFMPAAPSSVQTNTAFRISSALNGSKVIDVSGASHDDGAKVQIFSWNQSDAQLFVLNEVGNGLYEIENVESGKVVEVGNGLTANGSKINQYSRNGTVSQHWNIIDRGNESYSFINCNSGKALDVPNGVASDYAQLQVYDANKSDAQCWMLEECLTSRDRIDQFALDHKGTVDEGVYAIASANNPVQVIDVVAGSAENGANVQVYGSNGSSAQRWQFTEDESGYLTIKNVGSQKVLDVDCGLKANGTNIQQYDSNGSYAQKWIAVSDDNGSLTLYSALSENMVVDLSCGQTSNGTNVNLYESNITVAQKFRLFSAQPVPQFDKVLEAGTYEIVAENGKVFDVPGASNEDGTRLQVFEPNGTAAQSFIVEHDETDNGYTIKSLSSGKTLDVNNGDFVPGTLVQQWGESASGSLQRQWVVKDAGDGGYYIFSAANGLVIGLDDSNRLIMVPENDDRATTWEFKQSSILGTYEELEAAAKDQGTVLEDGTYRVLSASDSKYALDVSAAGKDNGANVQMYSRNGTPAQDWEVENLPNGFVTLTNVNSGKCLDVANGAHSSGSNVWQYQGNGSKAQEWLPVQQEDGSFILYSALGNGLVLDIQNGVVRDSANIWIYSINYSDAQCFLFKK